LSSLSLIRDSSIYLSGLALQSAIPIVIIPMQTRYLTLGGFGTYSIALAASAVIGLGSSVGLPQAILRLRGAHDGADPAGDRVALRLLTLSLVLGIGIAIVALLSFALPLEPISISPNAKYLIGASLLAGGGAAMLAAAGQYFRAAHQPFAFLATTMSQTIAAPLVPLFFAPTRDNLQHYLTAWSALTCFAGIASILVILAMERPVNVALPSRQEASRAIRFGLPLVGAATFDSGSSLALRLVLAAVGGTALAGQFQIAITVGLAGVAVVSAANNAWLPHLLKLKDEDRGSSQHRELRLLLLLGLATAIAVVALSTPLSTYLSGGHDSAVALGIVVLSVTAIIQAYCLSGQNVLFIERRSGTMSSVSIVGIAMQTVVGILLSIPFGLYGTIIAIVANYAFQAIAFAYLTRHSYLGMAGFRSTGGALGIWVIAALTATIWTQW
jgi:O-antigen/teichoic acid export membrane protein